MSGTVQTYRSVVALLLVVLGLVIAGRGAVAGAPFAFTAMGALMAGLGIYRLKLILGR